MHVLLTFDYELFFGTKTGTAQKCMIEPTNLLLALCRKHAVPMTFFVDIGYLICLEKAAKHYPELTADLEAIKEQVRQMIDLKCSVQLHIHPHWEKSHYDGKRWSVVTDGCYKLDDFSDDEIARIMREYHAYLTELTRQPVTSFRAGGWCIQPFSRLVNIFSGLDIRYDTSVFPGGKFLSPHYDFDFTLVPPFSDAYRFEDDVCKPVPSGQFVEVPIASWRYSPVFYWKLYALGRLFPERHKMMGDGSFLAQPGRKNAMLTHFTWNHVSSDGFYAGKLRQQARAYDRKNIRHFVVIGHPKGLTIYAIEQLDAFISAGKNKYSFLSFSDLKWN